MSRGVSDNWQKVLMLERSGSNFHAKLRMPRGSKNCSRANASIGLPASFSTRRPNTITPPEQYDDDVPGSARIGRSSVNLTQSLLRPILISWPGDAWFQSLHSSHDRI